MDNPYNEIEAKCLEILDGLEVGENIAGWENSLGMATDTINVAIEELNELIDFVRILNFNYQNQSEI